MIDWNDITEGTLLEIEWDDIIMDSKWTELEIARISGPTKCRDVGWFLNHDELNIRIYYSINGEKEVAFSIIPKGVIRNVRKINYKDS
mgnify:CR=1 FL=1